MLSHEICIRLAEDGCSFVYSIRRGADVIESAIVGPSGAPLPEAPLDHYYGGSQVMD